MSQVKGGKAVSRQNFSMHPDLMRVVFESASTLCSQRSDAIVEDRSKRVTYSKVVAALVFDALQRGLVQLEGESYIPTEKMSELIESFEESEFERPLVSSKQKEDKFNDTLNSSTQPPDNLEKGEKSA